MQGNLWKVGPSAGELMEGGPECRGTYGRWAGMQGNLWKEGPNAWELMEGGPECCTAFSLFSKLSGENSYQVVGNPGTW